MGEAPDPEGTEKTGATVDVNATVDPNAPTQINRAVAGDTEPTAAKKAAGDWIAGHRKEVPDIATDIDNQIKLIHEKARKEVKGDSTDNPPRPATLPEADND